MQHVVIYGAQQPTIASARRDHVTVDGVRIGCGLAPARRPAFDPHDAAQRTQVLVEVLGFSCNYRDKAFFVVMGSLPSSRCTPVGSEFVGRVVAVGDAVEALAVGDRVMPDQHYAGNTAARRPLAAGEAREGVATNQSSRRWIVLPAIKLRRVPDAMSTATAATFGLNAQTAYAMVRKAELSAGKTALIFGASSNTSLFLAGAARAVGARRLVLTHFSARYDQAAVGGGGGGPGAGVPGAGGQGGSGAPPPAGQDDEERAQRVAIDALRLEAAQAMVGGGGGGAGSGRPRLARVEAAHDFWTAHVAAVEDEEGEEDEYMDEPPRGSMR
jgi:hypothetical protein